MKGGSSMQLAKKQAMSEALSYSLKLTVPVMTGYLFLSLSFGILMVANNFPAWVPIAMSLFIYAGSMQFATVSLLLSPFAPLEAFLLSLMINARHLFYGITLLEKYSHLKRGKLYTIFGLTDETFSVIVSIDPPSHISRQFTYFFVTLLGHFYWVAGTVIGVIIGQQLTMDTSGIDFVLTALFFIIFLDQWVKSDNHSPALVGLISSIFCLIIFGPNNFMIPAMILILILFSIQFYRRGGGL